MEELPLLGLGHSLGALMQTLLYCQHAPYTEACAGLALVSWNNKPVSDAIPLFKELFVPALAPLEGPLEQAATATCQHTHAHLDPNPNPNPNRYPSANPNQVIAAVAPGSELAKLRRSNFDFVRQQLAVSLGQLTLTPPSP